VHDEWGLITKGRNVKKINEDIDLYEEVNDMPFHANSTHMEQVSHENQYGGAFWRCGWLNQVGKVGFNSPIHVVDSRKSFRD
jgi:hypothetical protein